MKINKVGILSTVAVVEGILIVALIIGYCRGVRIVVKKSYPIGLSPLQLALDYESPDKKFEELVKKYPSWIPYRIGFPGGEKGMSILTSCAITKNTNYIRILIANGADVEEAAAELSRVGADDAIKLLRQVQSEFLKTGSANDTNSPILESSNNSAKVP